MGRGYCGLITAGVALAASGSAAEPGAELSALLSKPEIGLEVAVDGAVLTDRDYASINGEVADEKRLWLCDFRIVTGDGYIDLILAQDLAAAHETAHEALVRAVTSVEPREPAAIWFLLKPEAAGALFWSGYLDLWEAAKAGDHGPVAARNWHVSYDQAGVLTFYAPLFEHWFDLDSPAETPRIAGLFEAVQAEECG